MHFSAFPFQVLKKSTADSQIFFLGYNKSVNLRLSNPFYSKSYFALKVLYLLTLCFLTVTNNATKSNKILVLLYLMLYLRITMHPIETPYF